MYICYYLHVFRIGMVQPQPDGPMQWDMTGEESAGALRVPAELAANEVVTRLLGDNQQLRGRMYSHSKYGVSLYLMLEHISNRMLAHGTECGQN